MPNVVRNLLGEGTLSGSMIPVYSRFLEEGREKEAAAFAGAALGILTLTATTIAFVGMLAAPLLVPVFFPTMRPATQEVTITLIRILFPMTGLMVVSAWSLGILNSHRRFFVSFAAPVAWNLSMIAAMIGSVVWGGVGGGTARHVTILAWAALVGAVLVLLVQLPHLWPHLRGVRVSLGRGVAGVPEAVRNFIPIVAARGVVNLSGYLDLLLAGRLMPGAIAVMGYAQTLNNLPISLFGTGVAAAELPEMSRLGEDQRAALAGRVRASTSRALYFLIPSAIAYVAVGDVVVGALYQTGAFAEAEVLVTWAVLAMYASAMPLSASSRVFSSAFYALRDTRTPARWAFVRVGVAVVVGIAAMVPLDRFGFESLRLGAAGLAFGSAVGAVIEFFFLRRALVVVVGPHAPAVGSTLRLLLAACVGAAAATATQIGLGLGSMHPVWAAVGTLLPFGVVYLAAAAALGQPFPLGSSSAR